MSFHIENLSLNNFVVFKNQQLSLNNLGLVHIKGKNIQEPWKGANSVGKSLIMDSLLWLFSGSTSRDIRADQVIGANGRSCSVSALISVNGKKYRVSRYRKDKRFGNALHVFEEGENVSHRKVAETEERLDKIIGCSFDLTRLACFQYKDESKNFGRMDSRSRAKIIDEIVGATEADIPERYKKVNQLIRDYENDFEKNNTDKEKCLNEIDHIEQLIYQEKSFLEEERKTLNQKKDFLKSQLKNFSEKSVREKIKKLQLRKEQEEEKIRIESEKQNKKHDLEKAGIDLQTKKDLALKDIANLLYEINSIEENKTQRSGKKYRCSRCGSIIEKKVADKIEYEDKNKVEGIKSNVEKKKQLVKNIDVKIKSIFAKQSSIKVNPNVEKEYRDIVFEIKGFEKEINSQAPLKKELQSTEEAISNLDVKHNKKISSLKKKIEQERMKYVDLFFNVHKTEINLGWMDALKGFYGPAGFRPMIMAHYSPILSGFATEYFKDFTSGEGEINISSRSTLASGKTVDRVDIEVYERGKKKAFPAQWSLGEGSYIDVSLNMAVSKLAMEKAGKGFGILCLDEITNGLSETLLLRFIEILRAKLLKNPMTILFTSHYALPEELFDQVWMVVKENGNSRIEIEKP